MWVVPSQHIEYAAIQYFYSKEMFRLYFFCVCVGFLFVLLCFPHLPDTGRYPCREEGQIQYHGEAKAKVLAARDSPGVALECGKSKHF